jgi:RNA recognition motif-containing protein
MLPSNNYSLSNSSKKLPNNKLTATCKLFVGNLATQTTGAHLQSIFHSYGHVIECVKVRERYGFVRFSTADEAQRALNACNGIQLNGYPMMVEYAQNEILISPKSSRIQTNSSRYYSGKVVATPITIQRLPSDDQENVFVSNRTVNAKKHLSSTLNPDASSFQFACSTSDYYSQSDRPSSRSSSSVRSTCLSPSLLSVILPLSCSVDEDEEDGHDDDDNNNNNNINNHNHNNHNNNNNDDDDDNDGCHRHAAYDKRSSMNIFIGDRILNLYGSNMNTSKHFNGKID